MDVDTRLWRSFTTVAEELHYGRAAERLHITQPALSRQIRDLERAFGVTLFDRTRAYRDAHRSIEVTISESFDDEQLTALAAGRIDAGFLRAAAAPPGIRLETLLTEPLLAALPADHRLARHDRIALSELAAEPFVFFPRHRSVLAYDEFIASCRAAGFSPAIVQEASGISALGLVAAGLGVTVVAASYQALSLDGVRFVPIAGHQLTLQVAWAAANTSTALPAFLDTARQIARQTIPALAADPQAGQP